MIVYDYTTGQWNANLAVNVSRHNIEQPPILQDKDSLITGKKGEVMTLIESGHRVQLLEDVLQDTKVSELRESRKLITVGTFRGINE